MGQRRPRRRCRCRRAVPGRPPGEECLQDGEVIRAAVADIGRGYRRRRRRRRRDRIKGLRAVHRDSGEGVDERVVNDAFLFPAVLRPGLGDRGDPVPAYRRDEVDVGVGRVSAACAHGKRPDCRDDREQHHGAHRHAGGRTRRPHHGRTGPVGCRDARDGWHGGPHRQAPRRRHGDPAHGDVDPVGGVSDGRGWDQQRAEAGQRSGERELKGADAWVEAVAGEEDRDDHSPAGGRERTGERPRVCPGPRPPDRDLREAQHAGQDTEQDGRTGHDHAV